MKNTAQKYCYEKVAKPDSPLYYSLQKLKFTQRDIVVAIHAFYREMEDILIECQDHQLALIKFNWWRGEVAKLTIDQPDHPVLIVLQQQGEKVQNRLLNIIDGFQQDSISTQFNTFEETVVHWMRTAGERELLLNEFLQNETIVSADVIYQLMLVIEIIYYIQHLHFYVRHKLIYFPLDELQQFHVTEEMLNEYATTDAIKQLLQYQADKVQRAYAVMKELSNKQRKALSHLVIRCEIACKVFQEIEKMNFRVLENLIVLTPLRYWWIAFCG